MSERERFTAYITKYALSSGIREATVERFASAPTMVSEVGALFVNHHGNDWHLTKEDAVKRAEAMRIAKIASLEKQIAKLRKLKFD